MSIPAASLYEMELYEDLQELWATEKCSVPFVKCLCDKEGYNCSEKVRECRKNLPPYHELHLMSQKHKIFLRSQHVFAECMQKNWYDTPDFTNKNFTDIDWKKKRQVTFECDEEYLKVRNRVAEAVKVKRSHTDTMAVDPKEWTG